MAVWIVQAKTLQPVRRLEDTVILHPDNRDSLDAQELFASLHHNKLWLLCGCKKPDARMFVRMISPDRYALVNHSEHGLHDQYCPLATNVKGEAPERQEPDASDGGAASAKQSEYRLLSPFRKVDLLALDGAVPDEGNEQDVVTMEVVEGQSPKESPVKNPANKIDFLYRLMWQLIDDSFCAHRHPGQKVSPTDMQIKLRSAAFRVNLKSFGPLQDFTFTGPKGLEILYSKLSNAHRKNPKIRHQFLFLCVVTDVAHNMMGVSATLPDGTALVLGAAKRPALVINGMGESAGEGPYLLAAVYGFQKPGDDSPMILKWALQPLVSLDILLPVTSWPERLIVAEMVSQLDRFTADSKIERGYKTWIHKPVLPAQDKMTGVWLQPVISLVAKDLRGERCRVAYRMSAEMDNLEAYRRTFEHVHTLDSNTPASLAASCKELFLIGIGVFERHYKARAEEEAEHERQISAQKVGDRMQERERQLLDSRVPEDS